MRKYTILVSAMIAGLSLWSFSAASSDLKKPADDKKQYTGSTIVPDKESTKPNTTSKPDLPASSNPCPSGSKKGDHQSECPEPSGSPVK